MTGPDESFAAVAPDLLDGVEADALRTALVALLTRPEPVLDLRHVAPVRASVTDAVAELVDELPRMGATTFRALTSACVERLEVVVRFLAVLELFKAGLVEVDQQGNFGSIRIEWTGPADGLTG